MSFGTIILNQNIKKNAKLCHMDTGSFILHIKTEDFQKDIADNVKKNMIHQITKLIDITKKMNKKSHRLNVIMNKISSKIALVNLNLSFIKDMLMTPCYFDQKIILKNSDVILIANILILSFHLSQKKENKSILFLDIKIRRFNNSFSTNIYCKVTSSGGFHEF